MVPSSEASNCRLCGVPIAEGESRRRLCSVCDEYAQHVALHSDQGLELVVGKLQNGPVFRAASKNRH